MYNVWVVQLVLHKASQAHFKQFYEFYALTGLSNERATCGRSENRTHAADKLLLLLQCLSVILFITRYM